MLNPSNPLRQPQKRSKAVLKLHFLVHKKPLYLNYMITQNNTQMIIKLPK